MHSIPRRRRPNEASSLPCLLLVIDKKRLRWRRQKKIQIARAGDGQPAGDRPTAAPPLPSRSHHRRSGFARLSDHQQTGVYSRHHCVSPAHHPLRWSLWLPVLLYPPHEAGDLDADWTLEIRVLYIERSRLGSRPRFCLLACAGCLSSAASTPSPPRSDSTTLDDSNLETTTHPIDLDARPSYLPFSTTLHCALFPRGYKRPALVLSESLHLCS